jgi:hypothetical protein
VPEAGGAKAILLSTRGGYWYWLEPDFVALGAAYD